MKLNIGAGKTYIPGFTNIDISPRADLCLDLGTDALPFPDNSVELVFSYHTLEHIPGYLFALSEIYRVLRHGGLFLVGLPYVSLTEYHLVNPYHLHNFNEHSFDFFGNLKGSAAEENDIVFQKLFHRFHYMRIFRFLPFRGWCRKHLFNVVRKIDFGLVAIKEDTPVSGSAADAKALFDKLQGARIAYEPNNLKRSKLQKILSRGRMIWEGDD